MNLYSRFVLPRMLDFAMRYEELIELGKRGKKYGIASACIGGGQGMAVLVERA